MQDIKAIRAELKSTTDPEKEQRLRRLLQRLNDQHKASKKKKKEREILEKQKSEVEADFSSVRHPHFKNKCKTFFLYILFILMYWFNKNWSLPIL